MPLRLAVQSYPKLRTPHRVNGDPRLARVRGSGRHHRPRIGEKRVSGSLGLHRGIGRNILRGIQCDGYRSGLSEAPPICDAAGDAARGEV